jgi:hypothetical protein
MKQTGIGLSRLKDTDTATDLPPSTKNFVDNLNLFTGSRATHLYPTLEFRISSVYGASLKINTSMAGHQSLSFPPSTDEIQNHPLFTTC